MSEIRRSRIGNSFHIPRDCNDCWPSGAARVRIGIVPATAGFRLGDTGHSKEMSRGLRPYGMDEAEIWDHPSDIPERLDVCHMIRLSLEETC